MGLDSVEIIMEVEKTFEIRIPDTEAEKIRTVGDFYDVVWHHLEGREDDQCLSQILFYKLRTALCEQFGHARNSIIPDGDPASYFPQANRRQAYQHVAEKMRLQFPSLDLPAPWSSIGSWTAVLFVLGSITGEILLMNTRDYSAWILLCTLLVVLVIAGVSKLLEPFRTAIPAETMRLFTLHVLTQNYTQLTQSGAVNRKDMEAVIDHIIMNKIGVDAAEISPEKSLTDDLGVN